MSSLTTSRPILQAQNLTKYVEEEKILDNVSLEAQKGELISIIGPSGCGKTTFLRCLNCLETPQDGTLTIKDIQLNFTNTQRHSHQEKLAHNVRRHIGMVFQDFRLFPHLNVVDNMLLAPKIVQHRRHCEMYDKAMALLDKVGLRHVAHRHPHALSGGQKQRAAIARALAMEPEIILYDEPTSALDPLMSEEVLDVMKELDGENITQIVVTHNMRFARQASDRIILMKEGRFVEIVSPRDLQDTAFLRQTHHFMRDVL